MRIGGAEDVASPMPTGITVKRSVFWPENNRRVTPDEQEGSRPAVESHGDE